MELVKYDYFKKTKVVLRYLLFFVLFYVLMFSGVKNFIFPFAFGALFALMWCNQKVYFLAPLYVAASLLANFSVATIVSSCWTVLVLLFTYMIHYKLNKPMKPLLLVFYGLVSQAAFMWLSVSQSFSNVWVAGASLVVGLLFLYGCTVFFSAVVVKGVTNRFKILEIITGSIFVMSVANGLAALDIFGFEIVKLVGAFLVLLTAYCFDLKYSLIFASVFAVGTMLNTFNAYLVAPILLWALFVNSFKFKMRFISVFALLAIEAVTGLYLQLYYSYSFLAFAPVLSAGIVFLLIPQKAISNLNAAFSSGSQNLAMRNIVNRNRDGLSRRFDNLSEVFGEMDKVFRSMIKGELSIYEAKLLLKDEVKEKFSAYGKDGKHKLRQYDKELDTVLLELITIALERKHITLLDIPPFITSQYSNINALVSIVHNTVEQYKQYAGFLNNIDASKVLIAEQLSGVSKIMRSLSEEVGKNVVFDNAQEDKILSELTYNNITCLEAVIYNQNPSIINVSLVVKAEDAQKAKIPSIISKILGYPMVVFENNPSNRSGWSVLELKNSPKFDVIFGTAGCPKDTNEVSGDSYSLVRIENDKFMMALCDGMGNGKKAENDSSLAVGLLENFYRAGFDNQIILSSVNNLLSLASNEDSFSALDICVLDLKNGISDFIKLGATSGFVKHIDGLTKIKCESLPIGIVREIKPVVEKLVLNAGDIVVLCTDGVADSFVSENEFENFLKSMTSVNPQEIAENILHEALKTNGGRAKDDMTVLVARIYEYV